jgi:aquaporin NIP
MPDRPGLLRRPVVEGIAAFALVFAGCGAVVTNATHQQALGTVGVSLVFGLVIMGMIYATGHLSGAHINPAVTIAFTLTRHFPPRDALAYGGATVPGLGTSAGSALVYEIVLTAFLMFVITAVAGPIAGAALGALAYQFIRKEAI